MRKPVNRRPSRDPAPPGAGMHLAIACDIRLALWMRPSYRQ